MLTSFFFCIFDTEPMDAIVKDTYEIDFHKTINSTETESTEDDKDSKETTLTLVPLEGMMDEKVISLYNSAKDQLQKANVELCLKTVPYSADLISLYCIPYISRANTKNDKALLEYYRDMLNKPSMDRAPDLNKLRREHLETGIMESTVIAQVQVWCNEVFYVKDAESGKVLQGKEDAESRNVPHLIRMEMTVKTDKNDAGQFRNIQGDWMITDIDDMLDGNLVV